MTTKGKSCPICRSLLDDNHYAPASFPGIDVEICCNCDENLGLMFTNFEEKPGTEGDGYIVPDYSDQLQELTGRTYQENRLLFYQACLKRESSKQEYADEEAIARCTAEIEKTISRIEKGKNS